MEMSLVLGYGHIFTLQKEGEGEVLYVIYSIFLFISMNQVWG